MLFFQQAGSAFVCVLCLRCAVERGQTTVLQREPLSSSHLLGCEYLHIKHLTHLLVCPVLEFSVGAELWTQSVHVHDETVSQGVCVRFVSILATHYWWFAEEGVQHANMTLTHGSFQSRRSALPHYMACIEY